MNRRSFFCICLGAFFFTAVQKKITYIHYRLKSGIDRIIFYEE